MIRPLKTTVSVFKRKTKLFNYWVGKHVAGNPAHFGFSFSTGESTIEGEFKILPLAYVIQPFVTHFFKSALNGFSLRIQNTLLE